MILVAVSLALQCQLLYEQRLGLEVDLKRAEQRQYLTVEQLKQQIYNVNVKMSKLKCPIKLNGG